MIDEIQHLSDDLLQAYLDGGCSPDEAADVETHLNDCSACRARLQTWQALFLTLDDLPDLAVPGSIQARVQNRLQSDTGPRSIGLLVFLETLVVSALGWLLWTNRFILLRFLSRSAAELAGMFSRAEEALAAWSGMLRVPDPMAGLERLHLRAVPGISEPFAFQVVFRLPSPAVLAVLGAGAIILLTLANRYLLRTTSQINPSLQANGAAGDEGGI